MALSDWVDGKLGSSDIQSGQAFIYMLPSADNAEHVLKRLRNPKRQGRFMREIENMQFLFDQGLAVAPILDHNAHEELSRSKDFYWYVMPYFQNGSLESRAIDSNPFSTLTDALQAFLSISEKLNKIHSKGIFHRDIKPGNILITDDEDYVFCDFGLSISDEDERLTEEHEQVGSRHWMAPEMLNGRRDINDESVDIYSMGKLLYYLLTGTILSGVGPYELEDLKSIEGEQSKVLHWCILGMLHQDPTIRKRSWSSTSKFIHNWLEDSTEGSDNDLITPERKIAIQEKTLTAQKDLKPKLEWENFANELKRTVSEIWRNHDDVIQLVDEIESAFGVRYDRVKNLFTSVRWEVSGQGIIVERDYGNNAMMRFQSAVRDISVTPIAIGAVAPPPPEYDKIELLVGVGTSARSQGYMSKLESDHFWNSRTHIGDPQIVVDAERFATEAAQKWCLLVYDLIENDAWV